MIDEPDQFAIDVNLLISEYTARLLQETEQRIRDDLATLRLEPSKSLTLVNQYSPNGGMVAEYRGIMRHGKWLIDHHPDWPLDGSPDAPVSPPC